MKVVGSGMAIMSDSSIGLKPVIEEPSKPMPPSKASSSSEELIEKLFSWPRTSVNQSRTKRTLRSATIPITSSAVWVLAGCGLGGHSRLLLSIDGQLSLESEPIVALLRMECLRGPTEGIGPLKIGPPAAITYAR